MKDEPQRKVQVNRLAKDDIVRMKVNHPDLFNDMVAVLKAIAARQHPLCQEYPIDICRSYPHLFAEGAYRVKDKNRSWRCVVFFLDGDRLILKEENEINRDCEVIEVVFADVRSEDTYAVLLAKRAAVL